MKNKKPRTFIIRVPTLSLLALALLAGSVQAEDIGERTDQGLTLIHKYCELIGTFPDFQDLISYVTPEHGNDHANFCSSSC
ncbi:hemolysin N-terminal domain-containing protein, partial [Aeromonas sp. 1HA1]|uniref:hemolysin N-terminal domain-containing protein n=1 Tax=Aeromonas sp. 1HA1 TaxID=2699193 RepID=UPI0023DD68E4